MKRAWMLVCPIALVCACHSGSEGQDVKTADEWLAEQEALALEDEKKKKMRGDDTRFADEETDSEKAKKFDKKQTKLELQRATRSAESCPGVVKEQEEKGKAPRGDVSVTIGFNPDGTVKSVTLPSPFDETPVGDCVINAYKKVLVPPFTDGAKALDWPITLADKKDDDKDEKKK